MWQPTSDRWTTRSENDEWRKGNVSRKLRERRGTHLESDVTGRWLRWFNVRRLETLATFVSLEVALSLSARCLCGTDDSYQTLSYEIWDGWIGGRCYIIIAVYRGVVSICEALRSQGCAIVKYLDLIDSCFEDFKLSIDLSSPLLHASLLQRLQDSLLGHKRCDVHTLTCIHIHCFVHIPMLPMLESSLLNGDLFESTRGIHIHHHIMILICS